MRANSRTNAIATLAPGGTFALANHAPEGTTLEELPKLLETMRKASGQAIKRAEKASGVKYSTEAGWFFNRQGGAILVLVVSRDGAAADDDDMGGL